MLPLFGEFIPLMIPRSRRGFVFVFCLVFVCCELVRFLLAVHLFVCFVWLVLLAFCCVTILFAISFLFLLLVLFSRSCFLLVASSLFACLLFVFLLALFVVSFLVSLPDRRRRPIQRDELGLPVHSPAEGTNRRSLRPHGRARGSTPRFGRRTAVSA